MKVVSYFHLFIYYRGVPMISLLLSLLLNQTTNSFGDAITLCTLELFFLWTSGWNHITRDGKHHPSKTTCSSARYQQTEQIKPFPTQQEDWKISESLACM